VTAVVAARGVGYSSGMRTRGSSRIRGFGKLDVAARRAALAAALGGADVGGALDGGLDLVAAAAMIENAVGVFGVPLGVAANFVVNGRDVLVPMAIEEPSVVAAASNAARITREGGGIEAVADPPIGVAQVELLDPGPGAAEAIEAKREEICACANATQAELVALGGGARDLVVRRGVGGPHRLVVHLHVDCRDAMGANMLNTMAEAISPRLERIAQARAGLRILTNLADSRLARASCRVPFAALARKGVDGAEVAAGVARASRFAEDDPYRAATHNKGIFNGIDALLLACGNDWRAVEAGGHAYAARRGSYGPLSTWRAEHDHLVGRIEMPMAVGVVGGAARAHPVARLCLAIAGAERGQELAELAVAVGLAQNLAALAALAAEGIQEGHMRLHQRRLDQR
jgi:hydroxymethylglutaryl-CoA reductase